MSSSIVQPNQSNQSSSSIPVPPLPTRTRSERVAVRSSGQTRLDAWIAFFKKDNTGLYIVIMLLVSLITCTIIKAWYPPFHYRLDDVTDRAIVCRYPFEVFSPQGTRLAVDRARWAAPHVFVNDSQPLEQIKDALWNTVGGLVKARSYEDLDEKGKSDWLEFLKPNGKGEVPPGVDDVKSFDAFIAYFKDDIGLERFASKLRHIFIPFEIHGVLSALPYGPEQGSQDKILVYRRQDGPEKSVSQKVSDVLIRDGNTLKESLVKDIGDSVLADQLFNWIFPKLKDTLKEDQSATANVSKEAAAEVEDVYSSFTTGQMIVDAGVELTKTEIDLLYAEYTASLKARKLSDMFLRFSAFSGTFFIVLLVAGGFIRKMERRRPHSVQAYISVMLGIVACVAVAELLQSLSLTNAEWEILPLLSFVMLIAITYSWELATVLTITMVMFLVSGRGGSLGFFTILLAICISATIQLGRLRTRKKIVLVSLFSGLIGAALTVTCGILGGREFAQPLCMDAFANFCWTLGAGVAVTAVLPFIERPFGILTDMYLMELGDISQPLLQRLIQLAPATYGHCIQVGSIAENAAEVIGARGLLTRVGAYFHDIGKTMKPEYYSENQGGGDNVHDHIEPQVSTLILIAHVKDGVDIAKQHRLPRPLIDLIEQHHGTSIVAYFYNKAEKGTKEKVEESGFRYPGPKPRSKEAAILMIADTCESASRSLGMGVAPGKVENMVHRLIKTKLDDGQFDESGLTLNELKTIEVSVIKSIIATMHGRIQYPEPEEKVKAPLEKVA